MVTPEGEADMGETPFGSTVILPDPEWNDESEGANAECAGQAEEVGPSPSLCASGEPADGKSSAEPSVPPLIAMRYLLTSEIARGGMGEIYLARDLQLRREVAVKVLLARHAPHPEFALRFLEEARITGDLQHPGVVSVHEVGECADGRPYYAMQYVRGRGLDQLLQERRDLTCDLPRYLRIFEKVCQSIALAHSRKIIHRDLKPANVMVGAFGEALVMDWGLAKRLGDMDDGGAWSRWEAERHAMSFPHDSTPEWEGDANADDELPTRCGRILGTMAYMPPEQARGEVELHDERSDVFGLGALLCEILTGRPPYVGSGLRDLYRQARTAELAPAFRRLDEARVDGELAACVRRCLAPDANARFDHAGELAEVVSRYMEATMRQSERDLIRFFELSLDLFCIAGMDGYFRRVNANFSRVLGYTDAELKCRPFLEFVHPEDRLATLEAVEQLTNGETIVRFSNRYRNSRHEYRRFEWTAKPMPTEGTIFAVARDVTEQLGGDRT